MSASKRMKEEVVRRAAEVRRRHAEMVARGETRGVAVAKLCAEYEMSYSTIYYYLRNGKRTRRTKP